MLRDKTGAHIPSLKLWMVGEAEKKVYVCVQSYDLPRKEQKNELSAEATFICCRHVYRIISNCLTLYCRKQYRSFFKAAERSSPHTTSLAIIGS